MKAIQHPTTNGVTPNAPGTPFVGIPFTVLPGPAIRTFWRPSEAEIASIIAGQPIFVQTFGPHMPPLAVGVDGVPYQELPA